VRVAHLGSKGIPSRGGTERVVEALVREQAARHEVTVYGSRLVCRSGRIHGARVVALPASRAKHAGPVLLQLTCACHALAQPYDVVHVHGAENAFIVPLLRVRFPVVTTNHGPAYEREKWGTAAKSLMRAVEGVSIRVASAATAVAKNQAEHHLDAFVRQQHEGLLEYYETQIQATEAKLKDLLQADAPLQERAQALDDIKSVGLRTALVILSQMPELGYLNRQEVAALAGLAPWTRDSGTLRGKRCIGGGRARVRVALYMCSLSAVRHNPVLRDFYLRLIGKGKPGKVAITAVMRKLIIYMNHQLKALEAKAASKAEAKKAA
jgi:transposase